jgi:hypothetical protein
LISRLRLPALLTRLLKKVPASFHLRQSTLNFRNNLRKLGKSQRTSSVGREL